MSHRPTTPPKRRLSLPVEEQQEKRPRSSDGRETSISDRRRQTVSPPPRETQRSPSTPGATKQDPSKGALSQHGSEGSLSRTPSPAAGDQATRAGVPPISGARPTWRTDSATSTAPSTSERPVSRRSLPDRRGGSREPVGQLAPAHPTRSASHPQLGASSRNYLSSTGAEVQAPNKQAAFVNKLYQMLEDPGITQSGLLEWSRDGKSFICNNIVEFAREVLPNYFKHNNWQSFVRQLNMYSFNKVSELYSTANVDPTAWEFKHPLFQRGEPGLLSRIKRKSNRNIHQDSATPSPGEEEMKSLTWPPGGRPTSSHGTGGPYEYYSSHAEDPGQTRYYVHGQSRPVSSGYGSVISQSESPLSHPSALFGSRARSNPQPPQPGPSLAPPAQSPSLAEPPVYYTATRPTTVETLTSQVATLQDTVHRLQSALQYERQQRSRMNLDMSAYLLRMTDWLSEGDVLPMHRDAVERQRTDLIRRYEVLRDSEAAQSRPATEERSRPRSEYQEVLREPHDYRAAAQADERRRPSTTGSQPPSYHPHMPRRTSAQYGEYPALGINARTDPRDDRFASETPRSFLYETRQDYDRRLYRPSPSRRVTEPPPPQGEVERRRPSAPPSDEPPKASLRNLLH